MKWIQIRGAREHNLQNLSLDMPHESLIVLTGVSGSGKSSLAFDTLYAEGHRRYVESLSAYARQFLGMMQKPDVDRIEGLPPPISIEQKTVIRNPRSTIGTTTEIYDYMRLLWARIGIPYSPATGLPIESQTVSQIVDRLLTFPRGTALNILAPVVRGRKIEYRKTFHDLLKQGYQRVKVDGRLYDLEDVPSLDKKRKHDIDVVVDRIVIDGSLGNRLADSVEVALSLSEGVVVAEDVKGGESHTFSTRFACPVSGFTLTEIEPRLFSFNNPFGACPGCNGLGARYECDPERVMEDPQGSLSELSGLSFLLSANEKKGMERTLEAFRSTSRTPWEEIPDTARQALFYGEKRFGFEGLTAIVNRLWKSTESDLLREIAARYLSSKPCPDCQGSRLRSEALTVKIDGKTITEVSRLTLARSYAWFAVLLERLSAQQAEIARRILKEIKERLHFLNTLGLGYVTLDRASRTLSGGESQRIHLASQLGSKLTGILYILDEPSIGLHNRDNQNLLNLLKVLRDSGNTVIVIEHDEEFIRQADWVIDMGPGAGKEGGRIVAFGPYQKIQENESSLTGQYLKGTRRIPLPANPRSGNGHCLRLQGARGNNLKNLDLTLPLGQFICVTGVSGSGKSTLILDTLYQALRQRLQRVRGDCAPYDSLSGMEGIDKVIDIDQSPIGRTPRSNPATYTGVFTPIRSWYSGLPLARARGYSPGRFSFNVKGGRCEACRGDGVLKVEMHFLPDIHVQCDECKGKRYSRETLEVLYKERSIADVLLMSVSEGREFFQAIPSIYKKLVTLERVGLGYITLGQAATTFSGGEAQRIKLAKELSRQASGKTLYILDEPTTGLHFEDIRKLLQILHSLVDLGNTVVIIEHNLDVIKTADWIIDLGPEGGENGGEILAQGPPWAVAECPQSYTGQYLKPYLGERKFLSGSQGV